MFNNDVEMKGSLTGVVWLPFQAKYARLYKYYRFRLSNDAFPKPIEISPKRTDKNFRISAYETT